MISFGSQCNMIELLDLGLGILIIHHIYVKGKCFDHGEHFSWREHCRWKSWPFPCYSTTTTQRSKCSSTHRCSL